MRDKLAVKRYCLALDLKNDAALIEAYKKHHQNVWPEVEQSIKDAGITNCEIYLAGNRLFMILETDETFTFEKKAAMDAGNAKVREWEDLMWNYQVALPLARPGDKWTIMEKVYEL